MTAYRANRTTIQRYTQSECWKLALELAERTAWDIAMLTDAPTTDEGYVGHAFCTSPCGQYALDIRGLVPLDKMKAQWGALTHLTIWNDFDLARDELMKWGCTYDEAGEPVARTALRILRRVGL